mgnify:FL=1
MGLVTLPRQNSSQAKELNEQLKQQRTTLSNLGRFYSRGYLFHSQSYPCHVLLVSPSIYASINNAGEVTYCLRRVLIAAISISPIAVP